MKCKSVLTRERRISFFIFISPWRLGFTLFTVIPLGWGLFVSLTNRMAFSIQPKFIGLKNYLDLIMSPNILFSFQTTFVYAVEATLVAVLTGFVLTLLLERTIWGQGLFRTLFYFPVTVPLIAVGWIFRIFLERDTGFLNLLLLRLSLISVHIDWLERFPRGSIVTLAFWSAGWCMLIFLGGLSTISRELYEVASIDGAGYFQKLRRITLPLLSPFIFFLLAVSLINSLQVFILPFLLNPYRAPGSGGGGILGSSPRETRFVMAESYLRIISEGQLAYGIALLWILFIVILIFTLLFFKLRIFWVYTETED